MNTQTEFICGDSDIPKYKSACVGEGLFGEYDGKRYCVLHYPRQDKLEEFQVAFENKRRNRDYNFYGVWFPDSLPAALHFGGWQFGIHPVCFVNATFNGEANFNGAVFGAKVDFSDATFKGEASFSETKFDAQVSFNLTKFSSGANFYKARFGTEADADFYRATFGDVANFGYTTFNSATFANFWGATFGGAAIFDCAIFDAGANFSRAIFKDHVRFTGLKEKKVLGKNPSLRFQFARIEKPERVSLHTLHLCPHWFVNVDCRKFEFIDIGWVYTIKNELMTLKDEITTERLDDLPVRSPYRLLAITYRQLAVNAEENHRYGEASDFRYNAFRVRQVEKYRGYNPFQLDFWYWLASGYGERILKASCVFFALIFLFALGYTRVGFEQSVKNQPPSASPTLPDAKGKPLGLVDAVNYSVDVVFLQKPEPKPLTQAAKWLVRLETLLGPAQAALLALAVRRRFMR